MWQRLANIILRNRFLIIGILTLLTIFFGYHAATGIKLDTRYGILLPNDAPAKKDYEKFKDLFGEDGGTLVIAIQTDSLYSEEKFAKWKELGDTILKMEGVQSVVSEATLYTVTNKREEQRFGVQRVFSDVTYTDKSIDSIKREIRNNPFYEGILYNDSTHVSLMMIQIDERLFQDQKKANIVLEIETLAGTYSKYFGEPKFAGLPHLRVVIGKRVIKEMYIFIALLIGISSALLYLFFRSLRVVMICNLVVAIAVTWSMGTIALFGFNMSIVMALIPPLMIVIGVPNCIFLITKFHQEFRDHGNKVKALSRVIHKIGTATFLTNFTTSLGFLTFITTNSSKLMEFGINASVNIMLVFVLSITILPIIISLSNPPKQRHLKHLERKLAIGLLNKLVDITVNHRKWVYGITILVIIISIVGLTRIETTGNLTGDLPDGHQIKKDLLFVEEHFGGAVPFEIMVYYKEPSRIANKRTLYAVERIESEFNKDPLFSKAVSYVDILKAANMAYYDNDSTQFRLNTKRKHLSTLKRYIDSSVVTNSSGVGERLNELLDTTNRILRIRTQMKDLGSYEVLDKRDVILYKIDTILNPEKGGLDSLYRDYVNNKTIKSLDLILTEDADISYRTPKGDTIHVTNGIATKIINSLAKFYYQTPEEEYAFNLNPDSCLTELKKKSDFNSKLRKAIDLEYFDVKITGTSVVAAEGTRYMVINLFTSLLFAILAIGILMAILFRSWRMVMVSLIPNFIPLLCTAGIMGWFGVPLKPSTLLIFSMAFGISIDDTIHYLAKYRNELKVKKWDLKECVIMAIRESGLGMFYTSIVLFCGFSMFVFSQFGGTQALGFLISITLLIAMITNLVLLPTLLLTLERRLTTRSFEEPFFDAYAEGSDIDWENLDLADNTDDLENKEDNSQKD